MTPEKSNKKAGGALGAFLSKQQPAARGAGAPATKRATKAAAKKVAPATPRKAGAAASGAGAPSASARRRSLADGREQLLVYLHPAGVKELKKAVHVEELGESVSAIVAEAVNEWLQRHGLQPLA